MSDAPKRLKPVYIQWLDAVGSTTHAWSSVEDATKLRPHVVHSLGWVVTETKDHVTLAAHYGDGDVSGDLCIPKTAIRLRAPLPGRFAIDAP